MNAALKRVGIVGGLGPNTTATFYTNLTQSIRSLCKTQPDIVIENVPVSLAAENALINGGKSNIHKPLLLRAIKNLSRNNVDFIVIPCNTVHNLFSVLQKSTATPLLNILETSAKTCAEKNIKKVGLIATEKTLNEQLYQKSLKPFNIGTTVPGKKEQKEINSIILRICAGNATAKDKTFLVNTITQLQTNGAEAVLLACTDLSQLINPAEFTFPVLDSLEVLQKATENKIMGID